MVLTHILCFLCFYDLLCDGLLLLEEPQDYHHVYRYTFRVPSCLCPLSVFVLMCVVSCFPSLWFIHVSPVCHVSLSSAYSSLLCHVPQFPVLLCRSCVSHIWFCFPLSCLIRFSCVSLLCAISFLPCVYI